MKFLGINLTTKKLYAKKTIKFYRKAQRILNNWKFNHATEWEDPLFQIYKYLCLLDIVNILLILYPNNLLN